MKPTFIVPFLVSTLALAPTLSFSQSMEMDAALRQMAAISMTPLQDDEQIKAFSEIVATMKKPKLDAFVDLLSTCSSNQDCSPQLESYELKFQEKSEEKIVNALRVANNQYKPSRGSRQDPGTANTMLYVFKLKIQPVIRKRYSEL